MKHRLTNKQSYTLTREVEALSKSQRIKTLTSQQFADEMTRELGFTCTVNHLSTCASNIGLSLSDLFKLGQTGNGRSVYVELHKLEQRVAELELFVASLK